MKRSFFILSAMLTLVIGAALLQSCSSESVYEEPLYGCYTEEEIEVIETMAELYGVSVEIDDKYNGQKLTLKEIENDLMIFSNLPGEYELAPNEDSTEFHFSKKELLTRLVTRTAEFPNTGEFVLYEGDMPFALYVSWQFATKKSEEDVVLVRAPYPYIIQGGGSHVLSREHLRLSYTHTYYHRGINYGRFNVSGIYYPSGKQEFRILKVQMGNSDDKATNE